MILADKIINERKKNGWSQEELADKLGVTRQSVSKWEGAQASPDLQRILQMSELFGVSTDYLLKDNCEEVNSDNKVVADANTSAYRVSMEEANAFLDNSKESAPMYALGTSLCVCSPIALIILAGASDSGMLSISENAAGGIGVAILLTLIAIAVAIFVTTGLKGEKYDYLENEVIETEYGVEGMVKERDNKFRNRFTNMITLGVVLCILGVVPIFLGLVFDESDFFMTVMIGLLFLIESIGTHFLVYAGCIRGSFQKLLQEEDYSVDNKTRILTKTVASAYWMIATAIYLGYSFITNNWGFSWIVWPIAGVLFPVVYMIAKAIEDSKKSQK